MKDFLTGQGRELALIISYLALFVFVCWLFFDKIERMVLTGRRWLTYVQDNPQLVQKGLALIIVTPVVIWLVYTVWWQGVKIFLMIVQKVWRALT